MENQHKLIKGYRDLSQTEINAINKIKEVAIEVGNLVDNVESISSDLRWHSIGKTDLQKGFMAIIRGIAKPEGF